MRRAWVLFFLLSSYPVSILAQRAEFFEVEFVEHRVEICEVVLDSSFGDTIFKEQIFLVNSRNDTLLDCDIYTFGRHGYVYVWYGYHNREIDMPGFSGFQLDTNGDLSLKIRYDYVKDTSYWFDVKKTKENPFQNESDSSFERLNYLLNLSVVRFGNRMVRFRKVYER